MYKFEVLTIQEVYECNPIVIQVDTYNHSPQLLQPLMLDSSLKPKLLEHTAPHHSRCARQLTVCMAPHRGTRY
jgi:hypothetical protein